MKKSGTTAPAELSRRALLRLVGAAAAAGCVDAVFPGVLAAQSPQEQRRIAELFEALSENWQEPWIWRPADWPGELLELIVIRNQNPGPSTSPGNRTPSLFRYNGMSPGPTVRVRGDGVVRIKLRNTLGLNEQETPVGPCPDFFEVPPALAEKVCAALADAAFGPEGPEPRPCPPFQLYPDVGMESLRPELRPGWSLKGHVNGIHAAHTAAQCPDP